MMSQPPAYIRQYAFVDWSTSFPTLPHSGQHLDTEFNAVKTTIDQVLVNMALLQRDDGKLHNGLVTVDSLSNDVVSLMGEWNPTGAWATATDYAVQDVAVEDGASYVCLIAHTSGTFATDLAAGKWALLYQPGLLLDGSNSPTADIDWDGNKITGLADGVADDDAATVGQLGDAIDAEETARDAAITAALVTPIADIATNAADIATNTADIAANAAAIASIAARNRLINPGFAIDQRGNSATSRADDAYCVDGWYVLTQTGSIQVTQQTLQEDGQPFSVRLTQNQSTAQRFGLAQIIAASECRDLRGQSGVLSGRIRCSAAQKINYAILGWTGTADTVTSDVVNDWTDTDLTAGNFFLASNVTVIETGSITPAAATWTDLDEITAALGSTFNNIIIMVWTDGTAAQNVTLDIGKMKFEAGDVATPFEYLDRRLELVRCRQLYRTFKGLAGAQYSTTAAAVQTIIDPPMRAAPTSDLAISSLSIIGIGAVSDLGALSVAINTADYFQAAATFTTAGAVGRPVSAVLTGGLSAEL
jgi:hypothetical protein